jgi:predicted dehydrogenase
LHREGATPEIIDGSSAGGGGADPMAFDHGPHRALLAELLDAIATGRAPMNAGASALAVQRLIPALLRSAAEGVVVRP